MNDDEITEMKGNREQLIGNVQERYSITKDEAKKQVDEFQNSL